MICFKCGSDSKVINSAKDGNRVYRHRKCSGCGRAWYTEEIENANPELPKKLHRIKDAVKKKAVLCIRKESKNV